jgi:hypothetical protein
MNKKAIATDAIIIIAVMFFLIIITTGTLFWLTLAGTETQLIEANAESINQGKLLRNYLRTPSILNNKEINVAELIIYSIKNQEPQLLDPSTQNIKQFFWKMQILNADTEIRTLQGNQEKPSKKERIILEQIIPNYINTQPQFYTIRLIIKK